MTTKRQQTQRRKTLRPHPARDQIVDAMRSYGRPISPTRLSEVTGNTLGSVAYHVRTLLGAGVVVLAEEGRVRGAVEHFYALVPDNEADLNDPVVGLQRLCGALTLPAANGGYPQPIALDAQGRAELEKLLDALRPKVQRIVRETAKRAEA
ncbi:MAG: winged helix-turn-helix transcriptional regulator [Conexibacter sp.]|nr:winged helix-turn-helix transcriptional regulator [Conexibacter sp.]